jgi:hypothetical protein
LEPVTSSTVCGALQDGELAATAGRGRMDRHYKTHGQVVKDVTVYPLVQDARHYYAVISNRK